MKSKKTTIPYLTAAGLLAGMSLLPGQTYIYNEEFDGTGNGYNVDSTTAVLGEDDWVDFANRITTDFSGNEGYFTAVGGTESVLTGASNSGDLQIRTDFAVGILKEEVGKIELRVRADLDQLGNYNDSLTAANVSLFYGTNTYVNPGAGNVSTAVNLSLGNADEVIVQADGWHLFVWDDAGGLTGGPVGTTLVNSFRLDALNGNIGASFEVDFLRIEESTLFEVNPVDPIGNEFTLREEWNWNLDGDQEGWTAGGNGEFTISGVSGGLLSGISNGGDSQLYSPDFQVLDVESGRFIIEVGITTDAADTSSKRLFWGLNGNGAVASQSVTFPSIPAGGSYVIRMNLDDVINDRITSLRYDPSTVTGITSNLDFIRIYSEGPEIPYIPPPDPPMTELDPSPLGANFELQQEWTFETIDDQEGWTPFQLTVANPNDGSTGVFEGGIFGATTGTDPQLLSPDISINAPASGIFVVEIDYPAFFTPTTAGQFYWRTATGTFQGNVADTPGFPNDSDPHTIRITLNSEHVPDSLTALRIDSTNENFSYYGIEAVRVYTDGPPLSNERPQITSFSYNSSTGASEIVLSGNPATVYQFTSAADLDFTSSTPVTLTGATVGTLSGGGVETDGSGNATVQFNLGTDPKNFVRAE